MKVGVISCGSPDYLIDIVTDGLIRLLGRQSLSLDYNVRGGCGGAYAHLLQGFAGPEPFEIYDADVLVASTRSVSKAKEWVKKTGKSRPIAYLDGEDVEALHTHLFDHCSVYFKREYLKGVSYSPKVRPLPFAAIPEERIPEIEVTQPVFYSAHETHPTRREIAGVLGSMGFAPAPNQPKGAYNRSLMSSLVGVAVRGNGWDTYRYWEVPYFGAVLLSQRLNIEIPGNFVDGEEAVFYRDPLDFRVQLLKLLEDKDRTIRIGKAGRKACEERHLSVNRARTVLERLA